MVLSIGQQKIGAMVEKGEKGGDVQFISFSVTKSKVKGSRIKDPLSFYWFDDAHSMVQGIRYKVKGQFVD
jgi:hypothetical protein